MNEHDHDLLQRATKVYLEVVGSDRVEEKGMELASDGTFAGWNPLDFDSDALDLVQELGLFDGKAPPSDNYLGTLGKRNRRDIVLAACKVNTPQAYRED